MARNNSEYLPGNAYSKLMHCAYSGTGKKDIIGDDCAHGIQILSTYDVWIHCVLKIDIGNLQI
jgi:hypothetical protein